MIAHNMIEKDDPRYEAISKLMKKSIRTGLSNEEQEIMNIMISRSEDDILN
jgi:hypothetical protein